MTMPDKNTMSSFGLVLRQRFQLNSAHPDLHKWIYALCAPSAVAALNATLYYLVHGQEATWPVFSGTAWAADTYMAPWIALLASVAGTVLFIIFARHKRVRSSTKIATSAVLSVAWLFTLISFLAVD